MTEIAIIMPVRNSQKYVQKAIESILNQTYDDFIFYIIDDFSDDSTTSIIDSYYDKRISVLKNTKNFGLSKCLNTAIKMILKDRQEVKYIVRQDGDDISEHCRIDKQILCMRENRSLGMLGTSYDVINENGNVIGTTIAMTGSEKIKKSLFFNNRFCHGSMIFRVDAFRHIGLYDETFERCQDYELYLRIARYYIIDNLPDVLYKWRDSKNFHDQLKKRKKYVMLARYKWHCWQMGVEYNEKNFEENMF